MIKAHHHIRRALKVALLDRGLTIAALARQVGHHRETVSAAINRGRYPRVLAKVRRALDA